MSLLKNPVGALAGVRLAVGAGAWLAPNLAGKAFFIPVEANPNLPFIARLFGARDVALAVGTVTTAGDARKKWLTIGAATDLADGVAALIALKDGTLPKHAAVASALVAFGAAGLGVMALQNEA